MLSDTRKLAQAQRAVRMAKDEQKVATSSSEKRAKQARVTSKPKSRRHAPNAAATAIGRELFENEVKNFVGLLASGGLSQKQFCDNLIDACRARSNADQKSVNVSTALRQLQYVLSRERKLNAPLAADYAKTFGITIAEFDEKLRSCTPASADVSPQPPTHPTIDKKLLSDPVVGVAFSDRGTMAEWNFGFNSAKLRLKENPKDTFLRAILVWSTLIKGNPDQIIEVV